MHCDGFTCTLRVPEVGYPDILTGWEILPEAVVDAWGQAIEAGGPVMGADIPQREYDTTPPAMLHCEIVEDVVRFYFSEAVLVAERDPREIPRAVREPMVALAGQRRVSGQDKSHPPVDSTP